MSLPNSRHTLLNEAEKIYSKATKAEIERDFDRAFQLYIKAAEEYLHLSRSSSDTSVRATCKSEAGKALERAEKIKIVKRDLTPIVTNHFAKGEQLRILQDSSVVNSIVYPLWTPGGFASPASIDISQPLFSPVQVQNAAVWKRYSHERCIEKETDVPLLSHDIVQHVVSDCSVCASIAVCIEHNHRFNSKLVMSALYPQDAEGSPVSSENGRHYVRVLFNGASRRVNIDDRLPMYPDGKLMCMSAASKQQIWPSLIEKAYMKLMGGYDFPGSLSSVDLYTLTGWIPEHIDIASPEFEREKTWRRIARGFTEGNCLITLGTGEKLSTQEILSTSLLPTHCYAVIDIVDDNDVRAMTFLDTWNGSTEPETNTGEIDLNRLTLADREETSRECSLPWGVVCNVFNGIYLNWNPAMLQHHLTFHGKWTDKIEDSYPRHFRLQLRAEVESKASMDREVWVLLTRHTRDCRQQSEYIALSAENEYSSDLSALAIRGSYTNNPHVLVKIECSRNSPIAITTSYDGVSDDVGFTITAYSPLPISWIEESQQSPYSDKIKGAFTSKNAGGNPALPTFMANPQYHLRVYPDKSTKSRDRKSCMEFVVQGDRSLPLNLMVVWSQGQRITEIVHSDIAATSGPYSYGHARVAKDLPAGDYTVIVSTFEERRHGSFLLQADGSSRFELQAIPQEGAGMFSKVVRGAWNSDTAAGGPGFNNYASNPIFEVKVTNQTEIKIRLHLVVASSSITINVTLFQMTSGRKLGRHIVTSGPYSDAICGVITPQTTLQPGTYLIVPSTFTPGMEAAFKMTVYSSGSGVTVSPSSIVT